MLKAALSVAGRVVVADSHIACFEKLSSEEQDAIDLDSGFYDSETQEFISETERIGFYDKEIYLIRHGECTCTDEKDPDITETAENDIKIAADYLSACNIESFECITSPLLRCLRTADILSKMLGVKFRIVPELIERPAFLKEGEVFKLRNHSSLFPHFDWPTEKEWHILPETYRDFHERVKETLQKIPIKSIVVTHYGYISLTTKLSLTKSVLDDGFPPASIIYFNKQNVKRLGCIHEEVL